MAIKLNNNQVDSIISKYKSNRIKQLEEKYQKDIAKIKPEVDRFISVSKAKIASLGKELEKFIIDRTVGYCNNKSRKEVFFQTLRNAKVNSLVKKEALRQDELDELRTNINILSIDSSDLDDLLKRLKITL